MNVNHHSLAGATASVSCALCYLIGFAMIIFIIPDFHLDSGLRLQAIQQHSSLIQLWYFIIFIVFGISLLLLSNFLSKAMPRQGLLAMLSLITSYVWGAYVIASGLIAIFSIQYLASTPHSAVDHVWATIYTLQTGLGEGVEWVGGIWMLLISLMLFKHALLPRSFNLFGMAIALSGLVTVIPGLSEAGALFGLSQIVWFFLVAYFFSKQKLPVVTDNNNLSG